MKIIVTGATGFIGKEIVAELKRKKYKIVQIGRTPKNTEQTEAEFYKTDIRNAADVNQLKNLKAADAVIHAAGLAHQFGKIEKAKFQKTNVEGTRNILELATTLGVKHFVLISSTAIYGTEKKISGNVKIVDENAAAQPQTFYAESKLEAENLAMQHCAQNNINLTIFRLAPVIGEENAGNVQRMIESIDSRRFVWIGKGENYKSLIYKSDVARACEKILAEKKNGTEIFNLAAEPVVMRDFVAQTAKYLNRRIPKIIFPPSLFEAVFRLNESTLKIKKIQKLSVTIEKWLSDDVYSAKKIERVYGFKTETSISEALRKQIEWHRKHNS